jgi:monothiol glutaredoxin
MKSDLETVFDFISTTLDNNKVVLFMKGSKKLPQCGFSAQVVSILQFHAITFLDVDVFTVEGLREGIKEFSSWPTIPQLYVNSKFIGGADIVRDLHQSNELLDALK